MADIVSDVQNEFAVPKFTIDGEITRQYRRFIVVLKNNGVSIGGKDPNLLNLYYVWSYLMDWLCSCKLLKVLCTRNY